LEEQQQQPGAGWFAGAPLATGRLLVSQGASRMVRRALPVRRATDSPAKRGITNFLSDVVSPTVTLLVAYPLDVARARRVAGAGGNSDISLLRLDGDMMAGFPVAALQLFAARATHTALSKLAYPLAQRARKSDWGRLALNFSLAAATAVLVSPLERARLDMVLRRSSLAESLAGLRRGDRETLLTDCVVSVVQSVASTVVVALLDVVRRPVADYAVRAVIAQ
jgi:hypothetical protein